MLTARTLTLSPSGRRSLRLVAILAALVGLAIGVQAMVLHLTTDPFADTRLYYDAATRLNHGLPLYVPSTQEGIGPYASPPLLAILFRPLALLPFPIAAAIWEVVVVGAFVLTLRRIGLREPVLIALGCLALPVLWALSVGQAEPIVTFMLALGTPLSVAFAANLKLVPLAAAAYWVGRRDVRSLARLGVALAVLGLVQLLLEPAATLYYLRFEWLRTAFEFRNVSPYAIHPALWAVTVVVLLVLALRFAPSRHGWAFAVVLAVLATPRLLVYQLMSLLAAFGGPPEPPGPPPAAEHGRPGPPGEDRPA